ncbi:hypothetical protein [Enterococcus olivae]
MSQKLKNQWKAGVMFLAGLFFLLIYSEYHPETRTLLALPVVLTILLFLIGMDYYMDGEDQRRQLFDRKDYLLVWSSGSVLMLVTLFAADYSDSLPRESLVIALPALGLMLALFGFMIFKAARKEAQEVTGTHPMPPKLRARVRSVLIQLTVILILCVLAFHQREDLIFKQHVGMINVMFMACMLYFWEAEKSGRLRAKDQWWAWAVYLGLMLFLLIDIDSLLMGSYYSLFAIGSTMLLSFVLGGYFYLEDRRSSVKDKK